MGYWMVIALWSGWLFYKWLGASSRLKHPIVGFGKCISYLEKKLNRGKHRQLKGALIAILCITITFVLTHALLLLSAALGLQLEFLAKEYDLLPKSFFGLALVVYLIVSAVLVFYGLAGTTLLHQVRTAALETLSENLNDGVIAPLFWFLIGGLPAMMCYKMINTMNSMIGYKNERNKSFGYWAAKINDVANYLPARLTAVLIILSSRFPHARTKATRNIKEQFRFLFTYGPCHASLNSKWPEAALASVFGCRLEDKKGGLAVSQYTEILMILLCTLLLILLRNTLPFC